MKKELSTKIKKIITSILLTLTLTFALTGCMITSSESVKLKTPTIQFDSVKEMVYWNSVDGANKYTVNVDGQAETVNVTFYDLSTLSQGTHQIKVKALPSKLGDNQSDYCEPITVSVSNEDGGGSNLPTQNPSDSSENVEQIVNDISGEIMLSNFTIYLTSKQVSGIVTQRTSHSQGSGMVFKKVLNTSYMGETYDYYILTNNHVIYKDTANYNSFSYSVTDAFNVEYNAQVVANDPNYDLAVVKFSSRENYPVRPLATQNCSEGDKIISIGQPNGQKNAITFGKILGYTKTAITVKPDADKSNVQFDVYRHTAPIDNGSSGGAILDYDFNIVGVNYASSETLSGAHQYSFSIPLTKVKEFLSMQNITV